ncbi:MAG: hypothetical protein U0936_06545 [Planctomycetaceae bacterium]
MTSRRAREKADFLASTDTWFRPVSLATDRDGALYLAGRCIVCGSDIRSLCRMMSLRKWTGGLAKTRSYLANRRGEGSRGVKPFVPPTTTEHLVRCERWKWLATDAGSAVTGGGQANGCRG